MKKDNTILITDPIKQIIFDDELIDVVLEDVVKDSRYIEACEKYENGDMKEDDFHKLIIQIVVEHKKRF